MSEKPKACQACDGPGVIVDNTYGEFIGSCEADCDESVQVSRPTHAQCLARWNELNTRASDDRAGQDEDKRTLDYYQAWRGIAPEDACEKCQGSGVYTYANTTMWRGGIGGQAMTSGQCDACWGSGDKHRAWTDLRRLDRQHGRGQKALVLLRDPRQHTAWPAWKADVEALLDEADREDET